MRDRDYDDLCAELNQLLFELKPRFQLQDWRIAITIHREGYFNCTAHGESHNQRPTFHVRVQWPYRRADIEADGLILAQFGEEELRAELMHELMHILIAEMTHTECGDEKNAHEERCVEWISKVVYGFDKSERDRSEDAGRDVRALRSAFYRLKTLAEDNTIDARLLRSIIDDYQSEFDRLIDKWQPARFGEGPAEGEGE